MCGKKLLPAVYNVFLLINYRKMHFLCTVSIYQIIHVYEVDLCCKIDDDSVDQYETKNILY